MNIGLQRSNLAEGKDPGAAELPGSETHPASAGAALVQSAESPDNPLTAPISASASVPSASTPPEKPPYPSPAAVPTQEGPLGIRFDFNSGCRAVFPEADHPWRVRLSDLDTGSILFETTFKNGAVSSTKRYYIRFRLEAWSQDKLILRHEYWSKDRAVLIQVSAGTLGDTIGWFPYAVKFKEQHNCKLT